MLCRTLRRRVGMLVLVVAWGFPTLGAAEGARSVSPGGASRVDRIDAHCPTFSWGSVSGAERYRLVVYRVDRPGGEPELQLDQRLPGSATSWTPSLERCLERCGRYAWSVRAEGAGDASEWSTPRLFEVVAQGVADAPGVADRGVAALEEGIEGRREEHTPSGLPSPSERASAGSTVGGTVGGTLLSVDGGIAGTTLEATGATDSLDFDDLADTLTADATTSIDLDTNGADLDVDANTLFVDSSENRVGIGTAAPAVALDVDGDVRATGTITADGGMDLGMGSLDQSPGNPVPAGSLGLGANPQSVFVSGRYAYVIDSALSELKVIDVSDPSAPEPVGNLVIGANPRSVFVSGRYAYVVEAGSGDLEVIDVSDPTAPALVGSVGLGGEPTSVFVSGRYAYAVDVASDELKVIDVSDPSAPAPAGSLGIGGGPRSVFVSGRYAYVVDIDSTDLKVIDVSDPSAPALAGFLEIGVLPFSVFVSGRYAYVADPGSNELNVIDVSDPNNPAPAGSLGIGSAPRSVFVSGRYAYVIDSDSDDLKVIDVSDPNNPAPAGSLKIGAFPTSVFVSGRYAYVVDQTSDDLRVIDVTGAEFSSAMVHSLEAGSLQVRESLTTQGQLQVTGGATIGAGGLFSDGDIGIDGTLALATDIVPTSSPGNAILLYAAGDPAELQVRDESGNVTVLSPHNFSLAGAPSEPLAWSYYSEHRDHGRINVDMLRTVRLVEELSGERLVHARAADGSAIPPPQGPEASLRAQVEALRRKSEAQERENRELRAELLETDRKFQAELARLREELGLE